MQMLLASSAFFALLLPSLVQGETVSEHSAGLIEGDQKVSSSAPDFDEQPDETFSSEQDGTVALEAFYGSQIYRQFRIEQRVVIRITPRQQGNRGSLLSQLPQRPLTARYEERETDRCIPVGDISGVQTGTGNRLLLFTRDERILTVNLERACRARDFYSGFYIERNEDGQLCVDRDQLQSRSGARCEVERMSLLVPIED